MNLENIEGKGVIYMFTSPINKSYIGQTINFKERYKKYLKNKDSIGRYFSQAISKYKGIENFNLQILAVIELSDDISITKKELDCLETYYIQKFETNINGYNLTGGGRGSFKREVSEETRKKLSESNKGKNSKPLIQLECGYCKDIFSIRKSVYTMQMKRGVTGKMYCSRNCVYTSQRKK